MKETDEIKKETNKADAPEKRMNRNLGRFIAMHRKLRDMTQLQLSEKTGIDNSYISRLEKGQIENPRKETLSKIAKAMDINVLLFTTSVPNEKTEMESYLEASMVRFDPDNKCFPSYLTDTLNIDAETRDEDNGKQIDELFENAMFHLFKKILKEENFVRECMELLEKRLKKELRAKVSK